MIETSRRSLIFGGAALICAPAIVRASSLMPVKAINLPDAAFNMTATEVLERQTLYFRNYAATLMRFVETLDRKWFELATD